MDDLGQRTAHRGQRHPDVCIATLGLEHLVDEAEVDDVVADLRVDDGAQAVHQILRARHPVVLERQILEGVTLTRLLVGGGSLSVGGVVGGHLVVGERRAGLAHLVGRGGGR